jgi:hypothetical protein
VAACDSESSSSCLTPSHLFPEAIVAMSRQRKVPEWAVALEKSAALVTHGQDSPCDLPSSSIYQGTTSF